MLQQQESCAWQCLGLQNIQMTLMLLSSREEAAMRFELHRCSLAQLKLRDDVAASWRL